MRLRRQRRRIHEQRSARRCECAIAAVVDVEDIGQIGQAQGAAAGQRRDSVLQAGNVACDCAVGDHHLDGHAPAGPEVGIEQNADGASSPAGNVVFKRTVVEGDVGRRHRRGHGRCG